MALHKIAYAFPQARRKRQAGQYLPTSDTGLHDITPVEAGDSKTKKSRCLYIAIIDAIYVLKRVPEGELEKHVTRDNAGFGQNSRY